MLAGDAAANSVDRRWPVCDSLALAKQFSFDDC
jgi:hypothetical protein